MAPAQGGRGEDDIEHDKDVKHLLDSIGKIVYKEIVGKKADGTAKKYIEELKGNLKEAKGIGETVAFHKTCDIIKNEGHKLLGNNGLPCGNVSGNGGTGNDYLKRFSKERGAECANSKIKDNYKGSNDKDFGACAPYRRLSLCNKNMEKMGRTSTTKHDLLADVCMAAKYEGDSIKTHYPKYDAEYSSGSGHTTCTMLARSFADIGDIVRGRDLYLGNKKKNQDIREKEKLENKLKEYFEKIYNSLERSIKSKYNDDTDKNYYKLREDWWTANRATIWEAITCDDDKKLSNASYFRPTCDSDDKKGPSMAKNNCRCDGRNGTNADQVPTYFDYVPQFLRWFEEWAEDFCRKKKKYVDIVKTYCRGPSGKEKYCSRNGCDCTKTVRAKGKLRYGNRCTDCLFACHRYENWIDNQRKQFLKQKERYENVINGTSRSNGGGGSRRQKRAATIKYEGYEKKFYDILKNDGYGNVNKFLEKLSKDKACEKVDDEEGGKIDFKQVNSGKHSSGGTSGTNNENEGTFYRSKYCQPCPYCGMKKKENGDSGWEEKKKNDQCTSINLYKPNKDATPTAITILKSGENRDDIEKKLNEFCNDKKSEKVSLFEAWECYEGKDVEKVQNKDEEEDEEDIDDYTSLRKSGGLCILKNKNKEEKKEKKTVNEPAEFQKTFHDFFYYWVAHMLKDSIYWRTKKIKKCLENGKKMKCRNGCNSDCECFLKWIGKKKTEWENIKDHFGKQEGIPEGLTHDDVLEYVLKLQFLNEDSEEGSENSLDAQEIKHLKEIKKLLEKENIEEPAGGSPDGKKKTLMDKLIDYEEGIATKCLQTHNDDNCNKAPKPGGGGVAGRSETNDTPASEDEDDDEEEEEEEEEETAETQQPQEPPTTKDVVKPCDIVDKLFKDVTTLQAACSLKYGPKAPTSWKCVTSGKPSDTTGGLCIPPRRRRLYVGELTKWAEKQVTPQAGVESQARGSEAPSQSDNKLLTAFIQSAAIETFFLWDRYKQLHKPQATTQSGARLELLTGGTLGEEDEDNKDPEKQLQQGTIPEDFKRQMFYTLGDYRDILFGDTNIVAEALSSSEKEKMKEIQQKIKSVIENSSNNGQKQSRGPSSGGDPNSDERKKIWETHGHEIWEGMVCALTYKDGGEGKSPQVDTTVQKALMAKLESDYKYENVELEGEGATGAIDTNAGKDAASGGGTLLSHFVERPPYFRYLEEWGESFCRERSKRLDQIYIECKVGQGSGKQQNIPKCSCYGEDCETNLKKNPSTFPSLECQRCANFCSSYRRWIEKKKTEYEKQKDRYEKESQSAKNNPHITSDNEFYTRIQKYKEAKNFLENLGPCKKDSGVHNNKNFKDKDSETFGPADNCKPCSKFKIHCETDDCDNIEGEGCKDKTDISADEIENKTDPNGNIEMLVSDNDTNSFESALPECKNANIFKGFRKDQWKCRNVCGYVVCKPKIVEGQENGKNQIILIRALVTHWVQNFLEDYNKIKHKISRCMKNREESPCIKDCKDKCNCVGQWITTKKDEWGKIKERFLEQYEDKSDKYFNVRSCLEDFESRPELNKAIKPCGGLTQFKGSCGLNGTVSSKEGKKNEINDVIDCLIKKLENLRTKMTACQDQHQISDKPHQTAREPLAPVGDDELEPLEEEEEQNPENKVEQPKFCPDMKEPKKENDEEVGTCGGDEEKKKVEDSVTEQKEEEEDGAPAQEPPSGESTPTTSDETNQTPGSNPEQTPVLKPEADTEIKIKNEVEKVKDKAPKSKPVTPAPQPTNPPTVFDNPHVQTALMTSTLAWSVGIAFTALSYWLIRKKSKSSIDLMRIMEIPQNDYSMPTKTSPNRYVPYRSAQYKGKTYIYMEGDSDSGHYYEDTTDITSSSESEYEEMDLYVPSSPKYKTLIEVVLEPSKRDTQNDIPTSDIPSNKLADNEWNQLKNNFISNMLQNEQNDIPNNNISGTIPTNTNTTTPHDNMDEKPFIMSINDRNLLSAEEYSYDMSTNSGENNLYSGIDPTSDNRGPYRDKNDPISGTKDPISDNHHPYSGIDLINASLNGDYDIYDEILKRKENELFGTNHKKKNTSTNSVAKNTNSDPITSQLELFHKWLDRHRNMCEKWKNKEDILNKLKEEWNKENNNNGDKTYNSDNKSSHNHVLNTDVSVKIDMNNPKTKNEFTNMDTNPDKSTMDTILDDLEKYNEPYYYDFYKDDIYYDVNDDDKTSVDHINMDHNKMDNNNSDVPTKVQIEMNVINNQELLQNEYPISHM